MYRGALISVMLWVAHIACVAAQPSLRQQLAVVIEGKRAEIGVAVIINHVDTVAINCDERYPLMSVMKLHQAMHVAQYLEKNGMGLEHEVLVRKEDLKEGTYSPLRDKYPDGGIKMSVGELLEYTLVLSDNNACDLLFGFAGGPEATQRHIRSLGLDETAIVATEDEMHKDLSMCYENNTTPLDAARLIDELFKADGENEAFVRETMTSCRTGTDRLPKGIGDDAIIAHKTGTGGRNDKGEWIGINDVGHVILPDGDCYSLAVFIKDSREELDENERIIAAISHVVYNYVTATECD